MALEGTRRPLRTAVASSRMCARATREADYCWPRQQGLEVYDHRTCLDAHHALNARRPSGATLQGLRVAVLGWHLHERMGQGSLRSVP
jgi:hypothetical protein